MIIKAVIAVVIAYFLGNLSPSILISRMLGGDIRNFGSGNAGTTNMLRTYGKKAAAATLLIDVLKGTAAVIIGKCLCGAPVMYLCAVAVFAGHIWPVFFGFKGGKGIAAALGIIIAVSPMLTLAELVIAIGIMAVTKTVSAGSVAGAVLLPVLSFFLIPAFTPYALVMAVIAVYKHRANIGRLMRGEESKISFKK